MTACVVCMYVVHLNLYCYAYCTILSRTLNIPFYAQYIKLVLHILYLGIEGSICSACASGPPLEALAPLLHFSLGASFASLVQGAVLVVIVTDLAIGHMALSAALPVSSFWTV